MVDLYPWLQNAQPESFLKNEWSIYHPSPSFEFSIGLLGFYLDCGTKILLLSWHYSTTLITIFCKSWLSIIITYYTCFNMRHTNILRRIQNLLSRVGNYSFINEWGIGEKFDKPKFGITKMGYKSKRSVESRIET